MPQEPTSQASPAVDQVKLALERTFLAHERTLMAWVRTATSLITFGFALYRFYFYIHQNKPPTWSDEVFGARTYGLCMVGFGVAALVLSSLQHRQQIRALRVQYPEAPYSLAFALAGLMGLLGVIAFVAALFRL